MKMVPQTSYYLKTADEMRREFDGVPEALIAELLRIRYAWQTYAR